MLLASCVNTLINQCFLCLHTCLLRILCEWGLSFSRRGRVGTKSQQKAQWTERSFLERPMKVTAGFVIKDVSFSGSLHLETGLLEEKLRSFFQSKTAYRQGWQESFWHNDNICTSHCASLYGCSKMNASFLTCPSARIMYQLQKFLCVCLTLTCGTHHPGKASLFTVATELCRSGVVELWNLITGHQQ